MAWGDSFHGVEGNAIDMGAQSDRNVLIDNEITGSQGHGLSLSGSLDEIRDNEVSAGGRHVSFPAAIRIEAGDRNLMIFCS